MHTDVPIKFRDNQDWRKVRKFRYFIDYYANAQGGQNFIVDRYMYICYL